MSASSNVGPNWWMYHGDPAHTGYVSSGSELSVNTVRSLKTLHSLELDGPVVSVPAVVDGYVYVGLANSHIAANSNGGTFYKIDVESGRIEHSYSWEIEPNEGDGHGFMGMGCTPAVTDGNVYFMAFDGKLYCLGADTLSFKWAVDLRHADPTYNQPVTNIRGTYEDPSVEGDTPVTFSSAAGWSSPLVVDGRVYVGIGEGENPYLYSFVFCIDGQSGVVQWIFCTCRFEAARHNQPNELPAEVVSDPPPPGFTVYTGEPVTRGSSVWSSIAYDDDLKRIYCATGNPKPDSTLPVPAYCCGILSLDAASGEFRGFFQVMAHSSYRPSDVDIDIGASPTVFVRRGIHNSLPGTNPSVNTKVVGIGCKNGGYFILDAETLQLLTWRQLLPYFNDGTQIPTVDPHSNTQDLNPVVSNAQSNATMGENYHGSYSCAAIHPDLGYLYVGLGGANYNSVAPGIDSETTPFMRALDVQTLDDVWPLDDNNPPRYRKAVPPMFTNPGECGLSSPVVVNDVVFCSTSKVSIYAFDAKDGTVLWQDDLGAQTAGYNGGYGFCMGPAVWRNYVVAGALVMGRKGGILKIYGLETH